MGILYHIRKEYCSEELLEKNVPKNPFDLFHNWFEQATESNVVIEPNAMALATVNSDGKVSNRMVLLKSFDKEGFVFFTNYRSRKARDLDENHFASTLFFWHALERQVRIEGYIGKISDQESLQYFNSRPRESQLGAWASPQSKEIPNREYIESAFADVQNKFALRIPRPEHWGGYRLIPDTFEFWQGRKNRLHDRIEYYLDKGSWNLRRLAP